MKRHLSVWSLLNRSTVFRLSLCLVLMCAAESVIFLWRAGNATDFETAVSNGPAYAVFGVVS